MKRALLLVGFLGACEPICGDQLVAIGEQCDDGNNIDNDTCTNACTLPNTCGNGAIDAGELCYQALPTVEVSDASTLAVADFDGDTDNDVVTITGFGGTLLLNNGTGQLTATNGFLPLGILVNPTSIIAVDVNNDARIDIVTVHRNDDVVGVFLNQGNGTFDAGTAFAAGILPDDVAAADLDDDGFVDLVTAPFEEGVRVLLNQGNGTFGASQLVSLNQEILNPVALQASDTNNDGIDNIVALDALANLHIISSNAGVLSASTESASNQDVATNFIMADLNGDSFDDVVSGDATIRSILSNGGALNGLGETFSTSAVQLASGDLDNNGSLDVALLSNEDRASAFVLPNLGNGGLNVPFKKAASLNFPDGQGFTLSAIDLAVAEMNGDGVLDLIASFNEGNIDFPLDGISVVLSSK